MYTININDDGEPQTKIFNSEGLQIAETFGDDYTEAEATAKLFAAAPLMLEALKTALHELYYYNETNMDEEKLEETSKVILLVNSAIAAAEESK